MASSKKDQVAARPPATTPERREQQLVEAAVNLAEKQIASGKVSSQVLTHYLKLGTTREQLEQERLREENALLRAKVESLASMADREETYKAALAAMRSYQGIEETIDDD